MKTIMSITGFSLLLVLATHLPLGFAEEKEPQQIISHPEVQGALKIIDAWLDGFQVFESVPGLSVAIVLDQEVMYRESYGYANLEKKVKADANTLYSICSISKLFTSIGIMQLRDAGKLRLDDPLQKHLSWFDIQQVHKGSGPITIEGLLTHSSGLPRESDFPYWGGPDFPFPTRQQMISKLDDQETLYPARQLFQYSNLGLALAGEIVSACSDQEYTAYVSEKILDPLEMNDTRPFFPKELHGKQMAIGYTGFDRSQEREPVKPFNTRGISPAAGFTSSVNDLIKFVKWQFKLLSGGGHDVLDSNTLREMHRVHWVDPDWKTTWGLGFIVSRAEDKTVVGHDGACPGYRTSVQMIPKEKLAVIVLSNASDTKVDVITKGMFGIIGGALLKTDVPPKESPPDFSIYEGNYELKPWGGEMAIRQWGDHLALIGLPTDDPSEEITKLKHVADHEFVKLTKEDEPRESVVFQIGLDGTAISFTQHSMIIKRIALPSSK
jgi:CubicO group peptidase (beta-lactamase class C family)